MSVRLLFADAKVSVGSHLVAVGLERSQGVRRTAEMEFFGEEAFVGAATPKRNLVTESDGAAAAGGGHGLPDVPSESMTRAEREDWVRRARKAMSAEQRLLLTGVTR